MAPFWGKLIVDNWEHLSEQPMGFGFLREMLKWKSSVSTHCRGQMKALKHLQSESWTQMSKQSVLKLDSLTCTALALLLSSIKKLLPTVESYDVWRCWSFLACHLGSSTHKAELCRFSWKDTNGGKDVWIDFGDLKFELKTYIWFKKKKKVVEKLFYFPWEVAVDWTHVNKSRNVFFQAHKKSFYPFHWESRQFLSR